MSDLSSLSHDYAASASFAEEINESLLKLKKVLAKTPGSRFVRPEEVQEARENLRRILSSLLQEISKPERNQADEGFKIKLIPEEFIDGIHDKHKGRFSYFVEDLSEALNALDTNRITNQTINILDDICDIADSTASVTFRRLWRR